MTTIAALYVEKDGAYFDIPDVDPWDESREARNYRGPYPVVAHPPCQRWGRYWGGGPSAKVKQVLGADGGCFASALACVRCFGGVLEHPEGSHAFRHYGIDLPKWREGWKRINNREWVCCVAQGNYGHRARKLTWLFYCGNDRPFDLDWTIPASCSRLDKGFHSKEERRNAAGLQAFKSTGKRLSTKENLATPVAFRSILITLAKWSAL